MPAISPTSGRPLLALLCVFLCSLQARAAAGVIDFSPRACTVYRQVFSLRLAEARANLEVLKQQEPANAVAPLLENYLDCLTIWITDDQRAYTRLARQMDARLARLARSDARSPYYLYAQAEIRLQWASLRGRYGDYLACFSEVKQAYALLEENQRRHPGFIANRKSLGILHALVGNVPDEYRWAIRALGGMSGTVAQGLGELQEVLDYARGRDFLFENETRVACAFLTLHLENNTTRAWQILHAGGLDPDINPLAAFVLAHMAMRTGHNDLAIRLLEKSSSGGDFFPFPYRDYLLGMAKIQRLDPDANVPLEAFLQACTGMSGVREAWLKLGWHYLLQGRPEAYRNCLLWVKTRGNSRTEPDKAALREANRPDIPDVYLLRARLLFDGGYYQRARDALKHAGPGCAAPGKNSLEYAYRMGRIAHALGDTADAVRYYDRTIRDGAGEPWYFACNAALQLGLLYEGAGRRTEARNAFRQCLKIHPGEYAASLHARAKAGLGRVPNSR